MNNQTSRFLPGILVGFQIVFLIASAASAADLTQLRCEYQADPLGIDSPNPRLAWIIESVNRAERQTAYRVLVASKLERLKQDDGDLWDSGKVASDQSVQVEYAGKPLKSGMRCYWKVRIWDKDGQPSDWSHTAQWSMGLLAARDWRAEWISPDHEAWETAYGNSILAVPPLEQVANQKNTPAYWARKVFDLDAVPDIAIAYVNVMGYYELYVNGQKVGDDVLSPAVSDHTKRSFYRTYDLTGVLRAGRNCVGLWMDAGWSRNGIIGRAQIDMRIGERTVNVVTDATWACAPSTHTRVGVWKWNNMGGERIDARRELPSWCQAEQAGGDWVPVRQVPAPAVEVRSQPCPPTRIGQIIPLASCTELGTNLWELDFGTNLTGWLRLKLPRLNVGQRVVLHYADKRALSVESDDTAAGKIKNQPFSHRAFNTESGTVAYQTFNQWDEFISAGKPNEQFCSKFNYHGFRYVIVEGLPVKLTTADAEALLIESDIEPAGTFTCSNELFNRIHEANVWTLRCLNLGGYVVDCPHRERLGYGDGQVSIESLIMSRQAAAFYGKWAVDWLDGQDPTTGDFPHTAPKAGGGGGPAWGGAACVLPWKSYLYYADRRLLERSYEPMRQYVEFLESKCTNGILRSYGGKWDFIGDWVPPGRGMDTDNWPPKPAAELFNNCYRIYLWDQLARVADVLGRTDEVSRCRTKIDEIRPLIHAAFFDEQKQLYVLDEQSYYIMPLMTGIVPEALRGTMLRKLEDNILLKNNGHLDTGMLGTYFLLQYLQETDRNDLIHAIMNKTTYPGWGYMLAQGATTFWEQWNGFWSRIHSCFTSPSGWFYQGLAGIRPDTTAVGFKKMIIKPAIVGEVKWAKARYDSIHGRVICEWKREADRLELNVTIPANTTATVFVPTTDASAVMESGNPAATVIGVQLLRTESGFAVFAVNSGSYSFASTIKR